jgi:hypothetical protein
LDSALTSDIAQMASAVLHVCCCVLSTALLDTAKVLFFVDFSTELKWQSKVVIVIEFGIFRFLTIIFSPLVQVLKL